MTALTPEEQTHVVRCATRREYTCPSCAAIIRRLDARLRELKGWIAASGSVARTAEVIDAARAEQRERDARIGALTCRHERCALRSYQDDDGTTHYEVDCEIAAAIAAPQGESHG